MPPRLHGPAGPALSQPRVLCPRVRDVLPRCCRFLAVLLAAVLLGLPAAALGQTATIPEEGSGVSTTPPVPLAGENRQGSPARELPDTGADPRMLFLAGLGLMLIGFGLRLRTADADLY